MRQILPTLALLVAFSAMPALALNPQPEPPGRGDPQIILVDGSHVSVDGDNKVYRTVNGKREYLRSGPLKTKDGKTLTIGPDDKLINPPLRSRTNTDAK